MTAGLFLDRLLWPCSPLLVIACVVGGDAPPVTKPGLRPDDTQVARVSGAWRSAGLDVRTQVVTPHGGRADLVAAGYAWEVELARHYHEGVGQACLYGADLYLGSGLVLVVSPGEERYVERATISARRAGVLLVVAEAAGEVPLPPGVSAERDPVDPGDEREADWRDTGPG